MNSLLTLKDPFNSESCIEIKIELIFFFFILLRGASKGFIFEAPQRSVKTKI